MGVWRNGYTLETMTPCNVMSGSDEGSVYHRNDVISTVPVFLHKQVMSYFDGQLRFVELQEGS